MAIKSTSNFEKLKAAKKPAAQPADSTPEQSKGFSVSASEMEAAILARKPKDVLITMRVPVDFTTRIDRYIAERMGVDPKGRRTEFICGLVESFFKDRDFK